MSRGKALWRQEEKKNGVASVVRVIEFRETRLTQVAKVVTFSLFLIISSDE